MTLPRSPQLKMLNGDILELLKAKTDFGGPFHALMCDPPYGLSYHDEDWDAPDTIALKKSFWKLVLPLLHPGAFGIAFTHPRTYHRLAVAIEDAGFIIHPTIFGWLKTQGMPRATNISKQIDRMFGVERVKVGELVTNTGLTGNNFGRHGAHSTGIVDVTESGSLMGQQWEGHRYGKVALTPSVEPIIVFQKPYPKKLKAVESMMVTGAGALNCEAARKENGGWPTSVVVAKHQSGNEECPSAHLGDRAELFNQFGFDEIEHRLGEEDPLKDIPRPTTEEKLAGLPEGSRPHPTSKPLALTMHLAKLLLPPEIYGPRKILNPFMGAGSEAIGAVLAGWEHVTGVEIDPVWCTNAKRRVIHYYRQARAEEAARAESAQMDIVDAIDKHEAS